MPKGSAAGLAETVVSAAILGTILGLSERRIRELRDDGTIPGEDRGQYRLGPAVSAYCAHIRPASGKAAAGGSDAAGDLDLNKARESQLRGDRLELLVMQMRAELIPADEMEATVGTAFDAVRNKGLAIPSRAAPLLLGMKTALQIQEKLTEIVHEALADLATAEVVARIQDGARRRAGSSAGAEEDAAAARAASASDPEPVG